MPQDREPIRVLIIPHQPNRNVKVRSIELARHLATQPQYEVYILTWRIRGRTHPNVIAKLGFKIQEALESSTLPSESVRIEDGIRWVTLPHLLTPYLICQDFNHKQLQRFVKTNQIQAIISGNAYHFPMPEQKSILRIYDVVDDHISPDSNQKWRRTRAFTLAELKKSDHVLTVSQALQGELAKLGFTPSTRIPNGVDLASFQPIDTQAVATIQARYELHNRFTVGYIGNHGWWAGLDLLLAAFEKLNAHLPESRLLIVGPGEEIVRYQKQSRPGVIFTGAISPTEITAYFHASSIGVLPFQPCPFTDNAMPSKILEYGAARKRMIATPLKELKTLQFPHVKLLEPNAALWGEALIQEAQNPIPWDSDWDKTIATYDWSKLWNPLDEILNAHFGEPNAPIQ